MEHRLKQLEQENLDLKSRLSMETEVKKSEVMLNKELKERIETLELQLQTVLKINEEFCNKVAKLRRINKELIDKC